MRFIALVTFAMLLTLPGAASVAAQDAQPIPESGMYCVPQPDQTGNSNGVVLFCPKPQTAQPGPSAAQDEGNQGYETMTVLWYLFNGYWGASLLVLFMIFYRKRGQEQKVPAGQKGKEDKDEPKILGKRQILVAKIIYAILGSSLIILLLSQRWLSAGILMTAAVGISFSNWLAVMEIWNSFGIAADDKKGHIVTEEKTTFKDVGGLEEVIDELRDVLSLYTDPEEAEEWGIRPTSGVLLVGPPGCGKTLIARAIAGEGKLNFLACSAAEIGDKFVRSGAQGIKGLFEEGRSKAPCLLFLDELDALGRKRGYDTSGEFDHALTEFLHQMDGIRRKSGLMILAATNREDILDDALVRPGRFDKKILIPLPDIKGRAQILKVHTACKKLAEDVDLEDIAAKTSGFSGADLEQMTNEAAQLARKRYAAEKAKMGPIEAATESVKALFKERRAITQAEIEDAILRVQAGPERKLVMSKEERGVVAQHEMGHAIVTAEKGLELLDKVTLMPRNWALGLTISHARDNYLPSKERILARITSLLGGRAAEMVFLGDERITTGAGNDFEKAMELAKSMVCEWGMGESGPAVFCKLDSIRPGSRPFSEETAAGIDREVGRIIMTCLEDAKKIISSRKDTVSRLAELLLEKTVLSGKEITELLKQEKESA